MEGYVIDIATIPDGLTIEDVLAFCKKGAIAFTVAGWEEKLGKYFVGDLKQPGQGFYQAVSYHKETGKLPDFRIPGICLHE